MDLSLFISQQLSNQYFIFGIVMAITAIPVGFCAGLFGIGGGLISVPVLFYIFGVLGVNTDYIMHLAVGTSFAIIVPTSISSVLEHHKFKAVEFNIVKSYGLFVIIGVILGSIVASALRTQHLILFFSVITLILGIYLIFLKENKIQIKFKFRLRYKALFGFISGFISAPMGIGGAVINVPVLKFFGYSINKAIGSAAAIGFLTAVTGTLGFLMTANYQGISVPLSIGFINIPTFLIFVPITIFTAKLGAKTVHSLNKKKISKLFGFFLLIVSINFFLKYFNF